MVGQEDHSSCVEACKLPVPKRPGYGVGWAWKFEGTEEEGEIGSCSLYT